MLLTIMSTEVYDALVITVFGMLVVFSALALLAFMFTNLPLLIKLKTKWDLRQKGKVEEAEKVDDISLDVTAAIAAALHMHFNSYHDEESNVITIKRVNKTYSPWSSKIYGLRNLHR